MAQTRVSIRLLCLLIALLSWQAVLSTTEKESTMTQLKSTEAFVPVTGGRVWTKILGKDKEKIPLLVVHGGPGAPHDYLEGLGELADERPVIFYDQLGCGNSDRPTDSSLWTVERFVEELSMLRDALGLKEIHLLGQSWGTMLCVEYIKRQNPSGIKSLILSAPYLSTSIWAEDQRRLITELDEISQRAIQNAEATGDYASKAYQDAMGAFYQKHLCNLDPWPENLYRTMNKMGMDVYTYMWGPSEFTVTGTLLGADLTPFLPQLRLPVLYTCGEFDEATPASTRLFQSLTPGSRIEIFPGATHQHHIEQKDAYNRLLRDFLSQQER